MGRLRAREHLAVQEIHNKARLSADARSFSLGSRYRGLLAGFVLDFLVPPRPSCGPFCGLVFGPGPCSFRNRRPRSFVRTPIFGPEIWDKKWAHGSWLLDRCFLRDLNISGGSNAQWWAQKWDQKSGPKMGRPEIQKVGPPDRGPKTGPEIRPKIRPNIRVQAGPAVANLE